jgi:hypothetical protein
VNTGPHLRPRQVRLRGIEGGACRPQRGNALGPGVGRRRPPMLPRRVTGWRDGGHGGPLSHLSISCGAGQSGCFRGLVFFFAGVPRAESMRQSENHEIVHDVWDRLPEDCDDEARLGSTTKERSRGCSGLARVTGLTTF